MYWFCHENEYKEPSSSVFRRMQIQDEEEKDGQIDVELDLDDSDDYNSESLH